MALCCWPCFTLDSTPAWHYPLHCNGKMSWSSEPTNKMFLHSSTWYKVDSGPYCHGTWPTVVMLSTWKIDITVARGSLIVPWPQKFYFVMCSLHFFVPIKTCFSWSLTKVLDVLSSWSWWHLTRVSRAPMSSPAVGSGQCCYWYTMVTAAWWWPRWPCNNRLQATGGLSCHPDLKLHKTVFCGQSRVPRYITTFCAETLD